MYACSYCDSQYSKWQGQCDECGKWGTIKNQDLQSSQNAKIETINQSNKTDRFKIGIAEVESVLGGGLVLGSLTLIAGDPGIGKSTLVSQIIGASLSGGAILYFAGEESPSQIGMRMDRLKIPTQNIKFIQNANVSELVSAVSREKPVLCVVDSIQTLNDSSSEFVYGSASSIKSSCAKLLESAKSTNVPFLIIGHITKDGSFAGPQTLAHMVDTVLYLEGDKTHQYRLLRSVKNRFGPTDRVGVFSMSEKGLLEVKNPSELFLGETRQKSPGSVVSVIMEGSRPFLVEIQSLTNKTPYGYPKRATSGFDLSRLDIILAVLERRGGLKLQSQDVFLNIAGGLKSKDTSLDLAALLAVASSLSNQSAPEKSIVIGEIGLGGEIRPVPNILERIKESQRLGFNNFLIPKSKQSFDISGVFQVEDIVSALSFLGIKK